MIIKLALVFIIIIGMVPAHYAIEDNSGIKPNYDKLWKEYEHDPDSALEKILSAQGTRAMYYAVAQIAHVGVEMSDMLYPHGMTIAVVMAVISLMGIDVFLYPILFVYVLLDERKMKNERKEKI